MEKYFLLHNIVKAFIDYNNYAEFPHKYFVSDKKITGNDVLEHCLCDVSSYRKIGEGWYGEAFVIDDETYKPSSKCQKNSKKTFTPNMSKTPNAKMSKSYDNATFKYLVKLELVNRSDIVRYGDLNEITTSLKKKYETFEIAKKAGKLGIGPKVFDAYECVKDKMVYFVTIMEYLQGKTYLHFYNENKENKDVLDSLVKDIETKVKLLNSHYILHKDVHGENIIVMENNGKYHIKLIDFGNAVYAVDKDLPTPNNPRDPAKPKTTSDNSIIDKLIFKLLDDKIIS
jgi:serine/threonine protein kinase